MKIQNKARKKEKKTAKKLGFNSHIASGALWFQKSDMSNNLFNIEYKYTEKKSYSLKLESLKKIENESGVKIPVFVIDFNGERYYIIKEVDFKFFMEEVNGD